MLTALLTILMLQPQSVPSKTAVTNKPYYVHIRTPMVYSKPYTYASMQQFKCLDRLHPGMRGAFDMSKVRQRKPGLPKLSDALTWDQAIGPHLRQVGSATVYKMQGGVPTRLTVLFNKLPKEISFQQYLAEYTGANVKVDGNTATITRSPTVQENRTTTYADRFVTFNDGLVITSSDKAVFDFEPAQLAKILKDKRSTDILYRYAPDNIPNQLVAPYLRELTQYTAMRTQRFDEEAAEPWMLRKTLGSNYLSLIESAYREIKLTTMSAKVADKNNPIRMQLAIEAKPDSNLAKLFNDLSLPRPTLQISPVESAIATAMIRCKLPKSIRTLIVAAMATNEQINTSSLGKILAKIVAKGRVDACMQLCEFGEGRPVLVAGLQTAETDPAQNVNLPLDGFANAESEYSTAVILDGTTLRGTAGFDGVLHDFGHDTITKTTRQTRQPIIQIEADLSTWANRPDESGSRTLLREFENIVDLALFHRASAPMKFSQLGPCEEVLDELTADGNWKIKVTVTVESNTLKINLSMGSDVGRFLTVRHYMMFSRVFYTRENRRKPTEG